jgi:CheY-like chemotaxis protein/nitrogen-specific signal transduction histidine kinase
MKPLTNSTILIVDDTPENIDILVDLLEDYDKKVAIDGLDALETVHSGELPDLILLDIMMPEMDGYEVCRKLREDEKTKDIPVIFLTAKTQKKDIIKGFEAGGQDYVTKPFDATELLHRVNTQLLLKKQRDELNELNEKLEEKVKERTFELNVAKEKAEESDRLKSEFISSISHEIRTPLNAVVGFSSFIAEANEDPTMEEYSYYIKKQTDLLLKLITDIVDFAKLESKSIQMNYETVDVNDILEEQYFIFKDTLAEGVELSYEKLEAQNILMTDRFHLGQILMNLLSNAIKFTEKGSIIFGAQAKENNEIEFYVKDTGIGIPQNEQTLIFERFYKLNFVIQGVGLGLAIVKNILEMMNGHIRVESEPEKGSLFSFTIPYQTSEGEIEEAQKEALEHKARKMMKPLNILIADDEKSNIYYYQELFKGTEHHIQFAKNGLEAINLFKQLDFDLILMDIKMPVMDGLQAIGEIKAMNEQVPILAVSAYAYPEDMRQAMDLGCKTFITKPFTKYKLFHTILDCF